jgi:hypothetical protein
MYPLGTWYVSGICVWIPCIKETMMMIMIIIIIIIIIAAFRFASRVHDLRPLACTTKAICQWNALLRLHYPMIIRAISQLVICRNSGPCPKITSYLIGQKFHTS